MRRRSLLASLAAGGLATLAGCSALGGHGSGGSAPAGGDRPTESYDRLAAQRVHVAPAVSLTLPSEVPQVDAPGDATLVILPGTTDTAPETGVDWLASGTGVALVGTGGQATLVEWMESDAYAETFESSGVGVGSPPPDFVVAFGVNRQYVSKHNFTWNGTSDPDDERYLEALEESLEDARQG